MWNVLRKRYIAGCFVYVTGMFYCELCYNVVVSLKVICIGSFRWPLDPSAVAQVNWRLAYNRYG